MTVLGPALTWDLVPSQEDTINHRCSSHDEGRINPMGMLVQTCITAIWLCRDQTRHARGKRTHVQYTEGGRLSRGDRPNSLFGVLCSLEFLGEEGSSTSWLDIRVDPVGPRLMELHHRAGTPRWALTMTTRDGLAVVFERSGGQVAWHQVCIAEGVRP